MGISFDMVSFLDEIEQRYRHEIDVLRSRSIHEYMNDDQNRDRLQNLTEESEEKLQQAAIQMQKEYESLSRTKDLMHELSEILQEKLKQLNIEEIIDWDKLEKIELPKVITAAIDKMIKDKTEQAEELAQISKSILEAEKLIEKMKNITIHRIEIINESSKIQLYIKKRQEIYDQNMQRREEEKDQEEEERERERIEEELNKEEEEREKERIEEELDKEQEEEKKRKTEEEERERTEEEKRKLEEQKKKEEEEKRRMEEVRQKNEREEKKRDAEDAKRKREQEKKDRMKKEIEDEEQAKKSRDSKYWPKYVYKSEDVEFDHKITCVIQCPEGVLSSKKELNCEVVPLLTESIKFPPINTSEDFVSSLIHVKQQNEEDSFNFNIPWKICIPYYVVRNTARESVIMSYSPGDNHWNNLLTKEVTLEDPLDVTKFAEAEINDGPIDIIFVVVSKMKVDRFQMGKKGGKATSSVDNRVNLIFPPECLKVNNLEISLQVQPMEASFLSDMKEKYPNETKNVITTSHIITFTSGKKRLFKPVSIIFTVPLDPTKKSRPTTAAASKSANPPTSARPKTAAGGFLSSDLDEELRIVCRLGDDERWKEWKEIKLIPQKNKDGICFDIENLDTFKFFVIRCLPNASDESLVRLAETVDQAFTFRTLNLVLRQHVIDMQRIAIVATPSNRISRTLQQLSSAGFEEGPEPSPDIVLREREIIHLRFRGNISPIGCKETIFKLPYNSQMRNRIDLTVQEIDKYAQKASDFYHGFAQFFVTIYVKKPVQGSDSTGLRSKASTQTVLVEEQKMITELLITLPKHAKKEPRPLIKAPFKFESEIDSISMEYLKQLALELGDEWKVLARSLGLSRARIEAIQENNVGLELEDIIFDMFLTWVKGIPIMTNKAPKLIEALVECERVDLAEELRDRELDHLKKLKEKEQYDKQSRKSIRIQEDEDSLLDFE